MSAYRKPRLSKLPWLRYEDGGHAWKAVWVCVSDRSVGIGVSPVWAYSDWSKRRSGVYDGIGKYECPSLPVKNTG